MTVVIPTYNWATVLPFSIGSMLAQSYPDWELVVVGDGCTDESQQVVASFRDRRIRWHNLARNGGSQVGPNNAALHAARGELFAYLGHDDLWLPDHLERLVAAFDAGQVFVHGRQLRIDPGRAPFLHPDPGWLYRPGDWLSPTAVLHRRVDGLAAGGWRIPSVDQLEDPEANLWGRLTLLVGAPHCLPAVTSVKLPAGLRSGVYAERPCDEQRYWWHRIESASGSASFVAAALAQEGHRPPERYPIAAISREFRSLAPATARERHRLGRISKGLEDRAPTSVDLDGVEVLARSSGDGRTGDGGQQGADAEDR